MNKKNNEEWWKGCVIYQIYPRSYQDSNNDGVGDLKGIVERLEYIAELGAEAIWISPFFTSPMKDFGYDVSDYRSIEPMFGSLNDFETLLAKAHKLNIKVMIDLVLSHTSDAHEWFIESRENKDNEKADWYVWADPKPDGTPPNNWLSIFGGPAWQWDSIRQQYYLHNFLTSQPDLNFHNVKVQDALLDVTRFWLDKGVDGFRLDTINFYFHDEKLRDNPALSESQRNASIAPQVNPYNHQDHIYSKNRKENLEFLTRFRSLLDEYDNRTCLGEIGDAQRGIEIMGDYTNGDTRAHMCYAFEFLQSTPANAQWINHTFLQFDKYVSNGWACWAFSNHDVKRHVSRWELSDNAIRTYAILIMSLRGSVCLYQGEELGLEEAEVPYESLKDPYGIEFWPKYKGRDGCRTPMVWKDNEKFGEFSEVEPWLPISQSHLKKSVSVQEKNSDSLLHHYRDAISLRKESMTLRIGEQKNMKVNGTCSIV